MRRRREDKFGTRELSTAVAQSLANRRHRVAQVVG